MGTSPRRRTRRLVAAALCLAAVSGCGGLRDGALTTAVDDFAGALRRGYAQQACAQLAPVTRSQLEKSAGRPCAEALDAQDLLRPTQVRAPDRFGRQAVVVVQGTDGATDTWFLSRFDARWLVVAAGCTARGGSLPYDCQVEGT